MPPRFAALKYAATSNFISLILLLWPKSGSAIVSLLAMEVLPADDVPGKAPAVTVAGVVLGEIQFKMEMLTWTCQKHTGHLASSSLRMQNGASILPPCIVFNYLYITNWFGNGTQNQIANICCTIDYQTCILAR
jgi:hypothetical protein